MTNKNTNALSKSNLRTQFFLSIFRQNLWTFTSLEKTGILWLDGEKEEEEDDEKGIEVDPTLTMRGEGGLVGDFEGKGVNEEEEGGDR